MSNMLEGPWHRLVIEIDTHINADGDERPGYSYDVLECPPECEEYGGCILREMYLPLEPHEHPGVGAFRVRVTNGGDLEWEDA